MRLVMLAIMLLVPSMASAQRIFTMDDSGAAAAGWPGAVAANGMHSRVHLPTGGRDGGPAWELRQTPGGIGENYWGWNGYTESADPPRTQSRFYRFWWWVAPGSTTGTNKILMIGDGCRETGPRCRVILTYRMAGTNQTRISLVIDGGDSPANFPESQDPRAGEGVQHGQWHLIQLELKPSSSASASDGYYKMWIDSNDYARPTAQFTNMVLNPYRWRYTFLGAYQNTALASGRTNNFRVQGFTIDRSFQTGGAAPPTTPTPPASPDAPANLRLRPEGTN